MTPSSQPTPSRVVVVGGGLAGMAAAVALESAGVSVTLIEPRRGLGGRASSFDDPQSGEELDNCQHVLLGCCTNLIDFYRRLGVSDLIRYERTIYFRESQGRRHDLWGVPGLPAPLHLGPAFSMFAALTIRERYDLTRAMLAMLRIGRTGREALADVSFGDWLDAHGQGERLLAKFYDPVLVSGLNELSRKASAKYAIQVFQDSLLAHRSGYVLGLPDCPLGQLYGKLPCRDVRLGSRVSELRFSEGAVREAILASGESLQADAFVLATNFHAVQKWIPADLASQDSRFAGLGEIESVPILGAHLWFDRPVMPESHAALLGGPLQWLFRKDSDGRVLHGVISAAREWAAVPKEECLRQFQEQIRTLFPACRAKLERGVIVIEKRATFSPLPGIDRLRPPQAPPPGGIRNLFLAGDYTRTGWPATMEGAVRSGYLAAEAICGRSFLVPDLRVEWPANLLKRRDR